MKKWLVSSFTSVLILTFLSSCEKDDCTKMVNLPKWDPIDMTFNDNFQEVPCDFDEPVNEPVI